MKTTLLYVHDTTACWMLWNGNRLIDVFTESVPRTASESNVDDLDKEGVGLKCPWLSHGSHKVRLVIDPAVDETRSIPAFDSGIDPSDGIVYRWRANIERAFLFLRSMTCNVWVDDSTRYRRDQLARYPKALLLWRSSKFKHRAEERNSGRLPMWQLTESGLPDFVFGWLNSMDEHGVVFTDIRLVSSLFALNDASLSGSVITVWAETHRWRLIKVCHGSVEKVEQFSGEMDARLSLDDVLATKQAEGETIALKYIGDTQKMSVWQESIEGVKLQARDDVLSRCLPSTTPQIEAMPAGCRDLPMRALVGQASSVFSLGGPGQQTDVGASLQRLLSTGLWRRRYKQSIIATTAVAAFSGYFVLLAVLYAFDFIDLHDRAETEIQSLHDRQASLRQAAERIHTQPFEVIEAVRELPLMGSTDPTISQGFLKDIADALLDHPLIHIDSVSWREVPEPVSGAEPETGMRVVAELMNLPVAYDQGITTEHLIFIAGSVEFTQSQQKSSALLMKFLDALAGVDAVIDVIPVSSALSSMPVMNFPSDVVATNEPTAFVVALRLSV